jgi:hypothetical protein
MISCLVPHSYDAYAQAPLWERLIARCTQCDETGGTAEFLKRALGCMLVRGAIRSRGSSCSWGQRAQASRRSSRSALVHSGLTTPPFHSGTVPSSAAGTLAST